MSTAATVAHRYRAIRQRSWDVRSWADDRDADRDAVDLFPPDLAPVFAPGFPPAFVDRAEAPRMGGCFFFRLIAAQDIAHR